MHHDDEHLNAWFEKIAEISQLGATSYHRAQIHDVPIDAFSRPDVKNIRVECHEAMPANERYLVGNITADGYAIDIFSVHFTVHFAKEDVNELEVAYSTIEGGGDDA